MHLVEVHWSVEGGHSVIANIPSLEDASEAWDEAEREQSFWRDHYSELLQQYPDQFVAVRDGTVVATNPDLYQLLDSLKHQGIELTKVWGRFFATDPRRLRL
jgi:hypothetical protein